MLLLALSLFLQAAVAAQDVIVRTFDDDKIGVPPPGFAMAAGREAAAEGWTVKREGLARVLVHEADNLPHSFAGLRFLGRPVQDVQVSVRFKAIGGGRRQPGLEYRIR